MHSLPGLLLGALYWVEGRPLIGFPDSDTLVDYQLHHMHLMTSDVIQPYPRKGPGFSSFR